MNRGNFESGADTKPALGSCLCGALSFHASGPLESSAHCHCGYCRMSHGAAFVTWVVVPKAQFTWLTGETDVQWYQSSPQSKRGFCSRCGSTLFFESSLCPGEVHVTRANLVGGGLPLPKWNCFVEQRVEWAFNGDKLVDLRGDSDALAKYQAVPPVD